MIIQNYQISEMAVGMAISFLSMLLNSGSSYIVEVESAEHVLIQLKKIFNINDKIIIKVVKQLDSNLFNELSDVGKFTSPYFKSNFPKTKNKPYIVLAMYQNYNHLVDYDHNDINWPNTKYRSLDEYSFLFKLIKLIGYEVITLDNQNMSLENKVKFLNDYVECVIGYEGGLCHIAHVLDIPCIVLPWKMPELFLNIHSLHLDLKTWFVDDFTEILKWNESKLLSVIESCKLDQGNNIFAQGQVTFKNDFTNYRLITNNKSYSILPMYRDFEIAFFQNNLDYQTFFGKPIVFYD